MQEERGQAAAQAQVSAVRTPCTPHSTALSGSILPPGGSCPADGARSPLITHKRFFRRRAATSMKSNRVEY